MPPLMIAAIVVAVILIIAGIGGGVFYATRTVQPTQEPTPYSCSKADQQCMIELEVQIEALQKSRATAADRVAVANIDAQLVVLQKARFDLAAKIALADTEKKKRDSREQSDNADVSSRTAQESADEALDSEAQAKNLTVTISGDARLTSLVQEVTRARAAAVSAANSAKTMAGRALDASSRFDVDSATTYARQAQEYSVVAGVQADLAATKLVEARARAAEVSTGEQQIAMRLQTATQVGQSAAASASTSKSRAQSAYAEAGAQTSHANAAVRAAAGSARLAATTAIDFADQAVSSNVTCQAYVSARNVTQAEASATASKDYATQASVKANEAADAVVAMNNAMRDATDAEYKAISDRLAASQSYGRVATEDVAAAVAKSTGFQNELVSNKNAAPGVQACLDSMNAGASLRTEINGHQTAVASANTQLQSAVGARDAARAEAQVVVMQREASSAKSKADSGFGGLLTSSRAALAAYQQQQQQPTCARADTYSAWSTCAPVNGNCGAGTQTRTHTFGTGAGCPAPTTETQNCDTPCQQCAGIEQWGPPSVCAPHSGTCGAGVQTRTRSYTGNTANCPAPSQVYETCTVPCPTGTNCVPGTTFTYGTCTPTSGTCGAGTRSRLRTGDTPATNGGQACAPTSDTEACDVPCGPVNNFPAKYRFDNITATNLAMKPDGGIASGNAHLLSDDCSTASRCQYKFTPSTFGADTYFISTVDNPAIFLRVDEAIEDERVEMGSCSTTTDDKLCQWVVTSNTSGQVTVKPRAKDTLCAASVGSAKNDRIKLAKCTATTAKPWKLTAF